MKFFLRALLVLVVLYITAPIFINAYNLLINKNEVDLFTGQYSHISQIRPKDIFFIDGRFRGFECEPEPLGGRTYCIKSIECALDPENTVYRIKIIRYGNEGLPEIIGNVSFAGELKESFLNGGLRDYFIVNIRGLTAEDIKTIEEFRKLLRS